MKKRASDVIAIALAEVGYKEKASNSQLDDKTANAGSNNYTKYARDLKNAGYYNGNKNGYAWCDVFVDWCFYKAFGDEGQKVQCQTGDLGAGCYYSKQYFVKQGRCDKNPKVGDQVFFTSGGSISHTGIVYEVSGSTIKTVEGNSSDQVAKRSYSLSNSYVDSFGHPWYDEETETTESKTETKTGAFEVGDIVNFTGTTHYTSANATKAKTCKPGYATITQIYKLGSSKHPYHCVRTSDSEGTVWGWVDEADVKAITDQKTETTATTETKAETNAEETAATTPAVETTETTYTVVKGDCLWNIAKKFLGSGTRYTEIKELNGLAYNTIYVGQVLKIPEK